MNLEKGVPVATPPLMVCQNCHDYIYSVAPLSGVYTHVTGNRECKLTKNQRKALKREAQRKDDLERLK